MLSVNVIKYDFLTGQDVLPERDVLENVSAMKRFEYSPLGKELNAQVYIVVKGRISATGANNANKRDKKLTFHFKKLRAMLHSDHAYEKLIPHL